MIVWWNNVEKSVAAPVCCSFKKILKKIITADNEKKCF